MNITDSIPVAIRALKSNPLRSFLTTLGVIIGVFIVITMVSMGDGAKNFIHDQMSSFGIGANTLAIYGAPETEGKEGLGVMSALMNSSITYRDIQEVKEQVKDAEVVIPAIFSMASIRYGKEKYNSTFVIGTDSGFEKMVKNLVASGRFINPLDNVYRRKVAFMGQGIVNDIFGVFPPVGEEIKINGKPFRVVGIMKEMSKVMGMDMNQMVVVPVTVAEEVLKTSEITETWVKAREVGLVPKVEKDIKQVLLKRHGKEDFQVRIATDLINRINMVMNVITVAISFVAAISLLVGSIGIMNIMLVSVTERISEIGIRKSVGARRRDIFYQFLVEAVVIASIGGVSGIVLGAAVLFVIGKIINLTLQPSLPAVLVSFLVAAIVGAVSGVYPAVRAARLDPVDALRG